MKGDINPVLAQRKKEKANQIKKAKAEKENQRNERLGQRSTFSLEKKIKELEEKKESERGRLSNFEERKLESLRKDLADIEKAKANLGIQESTDAKSRDDSSKYHSHDGPGSRSIYWDPILNPSGNPPKGYHFQPRPWFGQGESDNATSEDANENVDSELLRIPYPNGPLPPIGVRPKIQTRSDYTAKATPQTTYESAPVLRNFVKESVLLVPAAVQKKRKLENTSDSVVNTRQITLEDVDESDDEY